MANCIRCGKECSFPGTRTRDGWLCLKCAAAAGRPVASPQQADSDSPTPVPATALWIAIANPFLTAAWFSLGLIALFDDLHINRQEGAKFGGGVAFFLHFCLMSKYYGELFQVADTNRSLLRWLNILSLIITSLALVLVGLVLLWVCTTQKQWQGEHSLPGVFGSSFLFIGVVMAVRLWKVLFSARRSSGASLSR